MADNQQKPKVLIIGAGPGGLGLAQVLRGAGIPFEIFERDHGVGSRSQGWAFSLRDSLPRLEKALPNDLGDLYANSVNYGFKEYDSLKMYNSSIDEPSIAMGGVPRGQPGFILRVNRQSFRSFLFNKLEVSTKSNFTHYREDADGVKAFFQDGTTVKGTLLVGADGARSRVRNQLLGEGSKSELSKWFPLFAEGKVSRTVYTIIQDLGNAALAYSGPGLNFFAGIRGIEPDGTEAECYWSVYWATEDPAREAAWSEKASKQELFDRAQQHLAQLPSPLKTLVETLGAQAMTVPPVKYWEWAPPESLPFGRVTLLGDALHTAREAWAFDSARETNIFRWFLSNLLELTQP